MKSFTDLFIRRPVVAMVVNLVILIAGLQAIRSLNVRQYPRSDNATVTVTTVYVGASADLVRGFITTPLERAIAAADGIDYIESNSKLGLSTIKIRLKLNFDPTKALAEISSKVDQVRNDLPPEAEVPIINVESADSQFAAGYLSFTSDILEANQITDYLVRVVQPRLTALEGVQRADILGGRTFAMRIWLKPDRMAALNLSPAQVRDALAANNFLSAIGHTKGALVQVNLTANTDLRSVGEFQNLVVRQSGNQLVRLRDVADVVLGAEDYESEVRFSGERAVFMGIWPMPNANSLDVIKRVRAELASIQKELPSGLSGRIAYDATQYIEDAIHEVLKTLTETLIIVAIVIFLFLGSLRSVLVPLVAIPISLIGAVFLMQVFGFTLNLLTLLAVVLSVGLVVDDAIVIVENVERHVREGQSPTRAALLGARELVGPVIAMTITLAAVYAPIGLQGGLTGSLFREFAFTLAGAVFISGIVALTLSPVMSSKLLNHDREEHGFAGRINHDFDRFRRFYGRVLDATLSARPAVYLVWIVLALLAIPMFIMAPKELAPAEDQSFMFGIVEAPADATIDQTTFYTEAVNREWMRVPEANRTFQITFPDNGFGGLVLQPWGERKRPVFSIMPEVQAQLSKIPGVHAFMAIPPALPGGGQFPVEFVIGATAEPDVILNFAEQLKQKAAASGMFAFPPIIDTKMDQPEVELVMDRDKVASLGLNMATVGADLGALVGGNFVNRFNFAGRSYKVIPQVTRIERLNASQLENTYVKGPEGKLVPLSTFARLEKKTGPRSLNRFQQFNAVKISGVAIRPLDEALGFLEKEAAKILPKGYKVDYTGESRQLRVEGSKFLPAFSLALVLIFLVLAAQFNSFRDPPCSARNFLKRRNKTLPGAFFRLTEYRQDVYITRMSARIPTQHKSPFEIDPRPLDEMASPHAGLLATSRALRSLKIPDLVAANLKLKQRQRGCSDAQYIESVVLVQTAGGDCPEDMSLLAGDDCLERGLGFALPKTGAVRTFLNRFHDPQLELARPPQEVQKSFIMPSSQPVQGLQSVLAGSVRRTAKLYAEQAQPLRIATVDQDATIIESHKEKALAHYEGGRGYQPMVAVWAEADLVLADEFRDGNVPALQEPLTCAQLAFAALPDNVEQRYFRGDSACHENELLGWLKHPDRAKESGGRIGFAVSARMSGDLAKALAKIADSQWKAFATEADGTSRQWAEVDFVPGEAGEKKDAKPLRYVGLRLLKPQGVLFNDGTDRHHHAVVTNLDWDGAKLLNWHREKAGTVEHVHDEIKNALAGGHMPSQHFAVNAAWFKLALLSYNIASAIKGLCFSLEDRTARFKKYRLLLVHLAGRMSRFQCKLRLRFRASEEAIARVQKVWTVFALPTQATAFT